MPYRCPIKKREWQRKCDAYRRGIANAYVNKYKLEHGCSRCTERDPICLDFHHVDPSKKDKSVSDLVRHRATVKKITIEMEKCILLCANCHRKEHKYASPVAVDAVQGSGY